MGARRGGRDELLMDDWRRVRRVQDLLAAIHADPMASASPLVEQFVARSAKVAKRKHRRRRRWRVGTAVAAAFAVSALATALPQIASRSRINHAAIVTAGDRSILNELPEWSAVNAAALLVDGTPQQRELGRRTLLEALARPWAISNANFIDSVAATVPFAHGKLGAVVAAAPGGSGLAVVDVERGEMIASMHLPGHMTDIAIDPQGRTAVVTGAGVLALDLRGRRLRTLLPSDLNTEHPRITGAGRVLFQVDEREFASVPVGGGERRTIGRYQAVIDIAAAPRADAGAALVKSRGDRLAIVDEEGEVRARADLPIDPDVGALSPNRKAAIVAGADGQLWTFGIGHAAEPTGIAVPRLLNEILWASAGRVVLASDSERGQVFFLPRGERLGHVCWGSPVASAVRADSGSDTISCVGRTNSFWRLPSPPRSSPAPAASGATSATGKLGGVRTDGRLMKVTFKAALGGGHTGWMSAMQHPITATTFSPDGRYIVAGDSAGEVGVWAMTEAGTRKLTNWAIPDHSPVKGVAWKDGPIAVTRSHQTWTVPTCAGCQTDSGLLRTAAERLTGCMTALQLQWIGDDVRRRIGALQCAPVAPLPGA